MQGCCYRDWIDAVTSWNNLHEGVELQTELSHALDVLIIDKHKNVEMPSQSNVKSIVAYVEVGESRIFQSRLDIQLKDNPTLFKDQST